MSPATAAMPARAAMASSGWVGTQSGRITWMASGPNWAARRIRSRLSRALMWPAPSWKGTPAAAACRATRPLTRSYSSSASSWNSPAVPWA